MVEMLTEAGIEPTEAMLSQIWPVFKAFAWLPVHDEDEVQILVQWGTYDFYIGRDTFQFDLTRQFIVNEDGEYGWMEQLGCRFFFEPTPDVATLVGNMWSMDYADLDAYFAAVEQQPAFIQAVALGLPLMTQVRREEI